MLKLDGKNVLITGASSGIGQAIAIRFAQEGAHVAINHWNDARGAEATRKRVEECYSAMGTPERKTIVVEADVANEEQVAAMFQEVIESLGSLDVLVNNAGILGPAASHEIDMADFDRVVFVNLRGAFLCARAAIGQFLSQGRGGVILSNSSVHQIIPKPKYVSYSISKGGLDNMTRTLALEYASRGIRVNAVGPGAVVTPMNRAWINDPKARAEVESHIPMGRAARPEEIASVFAFLASDDASYITGQTIYACGGLTLYPEFRSAWASGE